MEYFNGKQAEMKEKSVYTLHLDAPRIIIIASVLIGIAALSFLLGMNLVHENKDTVNAGDLLAAQSMIPAPPHSGSDIYRAPDSGAGYLPESDILTSKDILGADIKAPESSPAYGDLTSDSGAPLASSVSSLPDTEPKASEPAVVSINPSQAKKKKAAAHNVSSAAKKSSSAKQTAKAKSAKKEKAVSSKKSGVVATVNEAEPRKVRKTGFAVQIASYDTKAKAENEIARLKKQSYDAYLYDTSVDGRLVFRVRIGPMSSMEKASKLLNELQENSRYSESYIVKQ